MATRSLDDVDRAKVRQYIDEERRHRGVERAAWDAAPAPPAYVEDCRRDTGYPRPCPALRCQFHLGQRGDISYSCQLDFVEDMPRDERGLISFVPIARVLGVVKHNAVQLVSQAIGKSREPKR